MGRVAFGQQRLDAPCPQPTAMRFRIIAAIPLDALWTATGSARLAAHRRNRCHQRLQLRDIVRVRSGQDRGQGEALCIGDDMMLAARFRFIRWIGPCFGPPFSARMGELSTTARDQSMRSAAWSLASNTSCNCCQTPASCQSRNRRQHVMPLPHPISWGRSSQPLPVFKTKMMPVSARRLSIGWRPGYRKRRGFGSGNSGSTIAHSSSSTSGFAIGRPPVQVDEPHYIRQGCCPPSFC